LSGRVLRRAARGNANAAHVRELDSVIAEMRANDFMSWRSPAWLGLCYLL